MEVRYELKRIEVLISKDIKTLIRMNYPVDQKLLSDFKRAIDEDTERIKENFSKSVILYNRKNKLKQYILYHKQILIKLAGYLVQYSKPQQINSSSKVSDHAALCQCVYWSLEELLEFVEKHFAEYFDIDTWIPNDYKLIVFHDIQKQVRLLEIGLRNLKVNADIINLALSPFNQFLHTKSSNGITYRTVLYLKELHKELDQLILSKTEISDPSQEVQWCLFHLNYNATEYFNFCTQQISKYSTETENLFEQIERLAFIHKQIHQHQVNPGFSFDPLLKPLKHQLANWITRETDYLETLLEHASDFEEQEGNDLNKLGDVKIKIDLSVAQLAYLIRVFVEIKIIQSQSISHLLGYITKFFQTKRREYVAYGSVHGKYYKTESSTKKAVRDLFLRGAHYIERSENLV